jgi:hypothetical protein
MNSLVRHKGTLHRITRITLNTTRRLPGKILRETALVQQQWLTPRRVEAAGGGAATSTRERSAQGGFAPKHRLAS